MMNNNTFLSFISLILSSFFRWWWALITGIASILSWLLLPTSGISLSKLILSLSVFFASALFFLTMTTIYQGWLIYRDNFEKIVVLGILRNDCYGGEHIVKMSGPINIMNGTIIQLNRFQDSVEVPIALVEIMEQNSRGEYQAKPIWFSPGHLNDFKRGKYAYSEINASDSVSLRTIERAREYIGENL